MKLKELWFFKLQDEIVVNRQLVLPREYTLGEESMVTPKVNLSITRPSQVRNGLLKGLLFFFCAEQLTL